MSEWHGNNASPSSEKPISGAPPLPPGPLRESYQQLQKAVRLLEQRQFEQAQAVCEALVRRYPNYVGALYTLGLVYSEQNKNEYALDCLARALMLSPRYKPISTTLAEIYLRLGANEMAAQAIERTKSLKPPDAKALLMLGDIYQEDCEYELARESYRQALAIDPDLVAAALGLGWCESHVGNHVEAADVFQGLIGRGVRTLEPICALAVLPPSVVNIDLTARLASAVKEPGEDQVEFENSVEFLRAAMLDRAGRAAEAWDHLTRANRAVFLKLQDRMEQISERWRRSIERLQQTAGKRGRPEIAEQTLSLFILGASRSGKTTMEQLVGTLAGVKRGYESPCLRDAVLRTFQAGSLLGSGSLELLPPNLYPLCRENYAEELGRRAGSAKVFTNTSPGHIHDAALISETIPGARFIFVKRDLNDNVLRIFMARYRAGHAYAYDLTAARDHVLQYRKMIDLMAARFPDVTRVINYEDLVANPAAVQGMVAELCGLTAPEEAAPVIGSDRGCAVPYRQLMAAVLGS